MNTKDEEEFVLKLNVAKKTLPKLAAEDIVVVARDKLKMTEKTFSSFKRSVYSSLKLKKFLIRYNKEYNKFRNILDNIDKVKIETNPMEYVAPIVNTSAAQKPVNESVDKLVNLLINITELVDRKFLVQARKPRILKTPPFLKGALTKISHSRSSRVTHEEKVEHFKTEIAKTEQNPSYKINLVPDKQKDLAEMVSRAEVVKPLTDEEIRRIRIRVLGIPTEEDVKVAEAGVEKTRTITEAMLHEIGNIAKDALKVEKPIDLPVEVVAKETITPLSVTDAMLDVIDAQELALAKMNSVTEQRVDSMTEARQIEEARKLLESLVGERNYLAECGGLEEKLPEVDEYILKIAHELSDLTGVDMHSDLFKRDKEEAVVVIPEEGINQTDVNHDERQEALVHAFTDSLATEIFKEKAEKAHVQPFEGLTTSDNAYVADIYDKAGVPSKDNVVVNKPVAIPHTIPVSVDALTDLVNGITDRGYTEKQLKDMKIPTDFLNRRLKEAKGHGDVQVPRELLVRLVREHVLADEMSKKAPQAVLDGAVSEHKTRDRRTRKAPKEVLEARVAEDVAEQQQRELDKTAETIMSVQKEYAADKKELEEEYFSKMRAIIDPDGNMSDDDFENWLSSESDILRGENPTLAKSPDRVVRRVVLFNKSNEPRGTIAKVVPEAPTENIPAVSDAVDTEMSVSGSNSSTTEEKEVIQQSANITLATIPSIAADVKEDIPAQSIPEPDRTVTEKDNSQIPAPVTEKSNKVEESKPKIGILGMPKYPNKGSDSKALKVPKRVVKGLKSADAGINTSDIIEKTVVGLEPVTEAQPSNIDSAMKAERLAINNEIMNGAGSYYINKDKDYMDEIFANPNNQKRLDSAEAQSELAFNQSFVNTEAIGERIEYASSLQRALEHQRMLNEQRVSPTSDNTQSFRR